MPYRSAAQRGYIFFVGPYDQSSPVLHDAVNVAGAEAGYELISADQQTDFAPSEQITEDVRNAISRASLVIGEVTERSPTVMWELGYAQALNKPVILLTQDAGSIPFGLKSVRAVTYQPSAPFSNLVARLSDAISAMIAGEQGTAGQTASRPCDQVFFSYSHADAEYLDRVLIHLRPVERSGAINLWADTKIRVGDRWREEIRKAVESARVAVLLISADFLASEFIVTNELPPLLAAAEAKGARIIPVIVKPSRFVRDNSLSRFQALNDPKTPIIRMTEAEREELYARLAEAVELEIGL